ncbi:hypothetical protein CONPUDRAFT_74153 [Coniophora puteana RWD-64-598 SS2]|uniref:Ribonuclease H1 N-terminal domain-containing protein n=1 Tax=Coniophora puteana (strain RWD-64-598) TaxID=741705 RepID=A0A5M3MLB3_CONPW|nr:uncharacterized protein CONPUDRAFT_74153 [Coniophora puteana RWD-64-598 SS2]EIW79817.1 hypothetical protein CONPUDRAFT_74153 [Coniophora puteana RWD-64-598 SS2]
MRAQVVTSPLDQACTRTHHAYHGDQDYDNHHNAPALSIGSSKLKSTASLAARHGPATPLIAVDPSPPASVSSSVPSSHLSSSPPREAIPQDVVHQSVERVRAWMDNNSARTHTPRRSPPRPLNRIRCPTPEQLPPRPRYAQKSYVVYRGLETGIFYSWYQANELVSGVGHATHKSFYDHAQAVRAYRKAWAAGKVYAVNRRGVSTGWNR